MTLLIGIACGEGVVLAADRQISHGMLGGGPTVGQPGTKIDVIAGAALYGLSGQVSIGQQLCAVITKEQPRFAATPVDQAIQKLQEGFRTVLEPAFATAQKAKQVLGAQASFMDVLCGSMLAARFADGIRLIDISHQGLCEIMRPDRTPFVCTGSGKQNADPIIRFLWNTYWAQRQPTLREAVLAAYWTVKIVIELKTPMVGYNCDVFVVEKTGKELKHVKARQLTDEDLAEHNEFIQAVEEKMRGVRDDMTAQSGAAASTPPVPGAT